MVALLRPEPILSKLVHGAGPWRIRRSEAGQPFYCAMLDGACRLELRGSSPMVLEAGDFVLIPAARDYVASSLAAPAEGDGSRPVEPGSAGSEPVEPEPVESEPVELGPGEVWIGRRDRPAGTRMLIGHCVFGSPDAALLVSLLPELVRVRGGARLDAIVRLVDDEARERRPGRELILPRLLEVLLIEALRGAGGETVGGAAAPGLVRGLGDRRVASALRRMHAEPTRPWTVALLAREASLSRSVLFERFRRTVGVSPMAYLLAWRMALAKEMLRTGAGVAAVAERVGYGSASTFSTAFARHAGVPPARYGRGTGRVREEGAAA